jgi:hypothetical protein
MSRTRKGRRDPGTEYWTARPGNKHGAKPGPASKKRTHRTERQQGRTSARRGEP